MPEFSSYGLIVTAKGSISAMKLESRQSKATRQSMSREQNLATLNERKKSTSFLQCILTFLRHVINAAKHPINLDSRQVDAVAARIELDLRIGYAFTRFQTLSLQTLGGPLAEAKLSYGRPSLQFHCERPSSHGYNRLMPVSHSWVCRRSLFEGSKLRAGTILEYKGHPYS